MFFRKNKVILACFLSSVFGVSSAFAEEHVSFESRVTPQELSDKTEKKSKVTEQKNHIKNLEFHRGLNGSAVFDVIFESSLTGYKGYNVELSKDGYSMTITFDNTDISDSWLTDIDTKIFNTIVDSIEVSREGEQVTFKLYSLAKINYKDKKESDKVQFEIDRKKSRVNDFNVNEPISVSFNDAPITTVLQVLSEFAGLNLVISANVQGTVSIDLKEVPWNEVMNVILVSKGLSTKKMNSILYVAPSQEISSQIQMEQQNKMSEQASATLVTEFVPLNFTTASAAEQVIASMSSGDMTGGVLSSRGTLTSDIRTNTLIVTDTEENLARVKDIIREIDIPNDQVLIESRIVLVDRTASLDLGFNYGVKGGGTNINLNTFGRGDTTFDPDNALGAAAKLAYTVFGGLQLEMEIQALEVEGNGNQASSPHLIVSNNETAFIKQGVDIPYKEASASGAAAISFKEAVLELQVTPQIAPDGNIVMELWVTKNDVDKTVSVGDEPGLIKREITTKIMAKDSQTIVIGGIYEKQETESQSKIPLLGDIPYLGYLFSTTAISNIEKEMLIFITPKVIEREVN